MCFPRRPSPYLRRVGFHIARFEACSTFTRVTACMLAEPLNGPFLEVLQSKSLPPRNRPKCFRLEQLVAGWDSHPLDSISLSRHTEISGLTQGRKGIPIDVDSCVQSRG